MVTRTSRTWHLFTGGGASTLGTLMAGGGGGRGGESLLFFLQLSWSFSLLDLIATMIPAIDLIMNRLIVAAMASLEAIELKLDNLLDFVEL